MWSCNSNNTEAIGYFQDKKCHRNGSLKRDNTQLFTRRVHITGNMDNHPIIDHRAQTPADIFTVKDLQDAEQKLTTTEQLLQRIHDDLKARNSDKDLPVDSVLEWTLIAMVLDRIFLTLFLLVSFLTSITILLNRPE